MSAIIMINTIIFTGSLASILVFGFMPSCFAGGFDNHHIGIKGMSMGSAMAGIVNDASAVYYNPGGLVFLEKKNAWQGEAYLVRGAIECEYTADAVTDKSNEPFCLPGFFAARTFDDTWALGMGFYVPYAGGGTAYQSFQGSPYAFETSAAWGSLTFAAAYKLQPNLSVGFALSLFGGLLKMKSFDPNLHAVVESDCDGISGYGGHIGLLYKPADMLSIGVIARSKVKMQMDGTVRIAGTPVDSEVEFRLPSSYTIGIGYKPNKHFAIGLTAGYRLYGDMPELIFKSSGVESFIDTYFKNAWLVGMGAEYIISNKWAIRGGLKYDQSSTKKEGLNPALVDVDYWVSCIGIAYNITESVEVNFINNMAFGFQEEYNLQQFDRRAWHCVVGIRFN
jgi:long-chain fatty acid transport protein